MHFLSYLYDMKYIHSKLNAAGVLAIAKSTGRVLLNRRGLQQSEGGTWDIFCGKFNKFESNPLDCAKREFAEETMVKVPYKISKLPFYIYRDNHVNCYTYIGIFENEVPVNIIPAHEAMDYGWFDLSELPDVLHPGFIRLLELKGNELQNIIDKVKDKPEYEIENIIFVIEL
jgi:8-oxo-dGTP pyrophosphatase MutT (NUDIX family)